MGGMPPLIVDLRSPQEFKGQLGRIRGAMNIPFPDLQRRVEELRGSTGNRPIVLVDRTDELSHFAVTFLLKEGFDWVYVLKGGMKAWAASKLPVYR
jgi:rhodanese-related sulfurtransferase